MITMCQCSPSQTMAGAPLGRLEVGVQYRSTSTTIGGSSAIVRVCAGSSYQLSVRGFMHRACAHTHNVDQDISSAVHKPSSQHEKYFNRDERKMRRIGWSSCSGPVELLLQLKSLRFPCSLTYLLSPSTSCDRPKIRSSRIPVLDQRANMQCIGLFYVHYTKQRLNVKHLKVKLVQHQTILSINSHIN